MMSGCLFPRVGNHRSHTEDKEPKPLGNSGVVPNSLLEDLAR